MLKTLGSTESTIRPKKSGVGASGDGSDNGGHDNGAIFSMLKTSSSTDSSTSVTQTAVEDDGVDASCGKLVKKSSKSPKNLKRLEKSAKSIGSEESSFLNSNTRLAVAKRSLVKTRYKTYNRELLAIVIPFKDWKHYLEAVS